MAAGRAADRASVAGYSGDSRQGSSSRSDSGSFGEGSMAAGRAADRASVAGYSGDSRQGSSSRSDSGSFGEGSMAAGRAADRASVAGYSGDSRQGSNPRSDSGSFGEGSMAAGRAADRASVAGYSGDSRQGSSSRSDSGSFGKGSMAAARAADRASVPGYSGDSKASRDRASFDSMVNSMAAARAADRRSVAGYSADSSPSVSSVEAARVADAYAEYARSMLQAGRTLSGRFSSLPSGASAISMNGNWVSVSYPDRSVTTYNAARYGSVEQAIAASKRTVVAERIDTVSNWANWATSVSVAIGQSVESLVNQSIRMRAAEVITRAAAKNFPSNMAKAVELVGKFPATNPANWASHVKAQWNYGLSLNTLQSALEKGQLPTASASQSAQEIGKLLANNRTALTIGRVAGQVGMWAGPVIGAFGGVAKTPADASWGTWTANGITGFAKQVDNAAVAAVGFTLGATASAPSAPATVGVGPVVVGTAAAYGFERVYDRHAYNKTIDGYIDSVGPYIGWGIDEAISWASSTISYPADNVR